MATKKKSKSAAKPVEAEAPEADVEQEADAAETAETTDTAEAAAEPEADAPRSEDQTLPSIEPAVMAAEERKLKREEAPAEAEAAPEAPPAHEAKAKPPLPRFRVKHRVTLSLYGQICTLEEGTIVDAQSYGMAGIERMEAGGAVLEEIA